MNDQETDWRLTGQEVYLRGAHFCLKYFEIPKGNENWDHEHCEFCWTKIVPTDERARYPDDVISRAYIDDKGTSWVCPTCFRDFAERFEWTGAEDE